MGREQGPVLDGLDSGSILGQAAPKFFGNNIFLLPEISEILEITKLRNRPRSNPSLFPAYQVIIGYLFLKTENRKQKLNKKCPKLSKISTP